MRQCIFFCVGAGRYRGDALCGVLHFVRSVRGERIKRVRRCIFFCVDAGLYQHGAKHAWPHFVRPIEAPVFNGLAGSGRRGVALAPEL